MKKIVCSLLMFVSATYLAGCGGNTYGGNNGNNILTYTVSGSVSGQTDAVTLTNGGANTQTVKKDESSFSFPAQTYGSPWNVIATGPVSQNCLVTSGSGSGSNLTSNVTIHVTCTTKTFTVSGTVTGNAGDVFLTNSNDINHEQLVHTSSGTFSFPLQDYGSAWNVVATGPVNQNCSITSGNGSGSSITSNITVQITCIAKTFTVSGTVTGNAGTVTLTNMGGSQLTASTIDGSFSFPAQAYGSSWNVVATDPSGQGCSVKSGIAGGTSITSNQYLVFQCSSTTYPVSGTVSGNTGEVTLTNNGVDSITLPANTTKFTFDTQIASGSSYSVTVANHPGGQICSVSNGSGNSISASVTNIIVACRTMHAYVVNNQDNTISQFSITSDGSLNAIGSVDVSTSAPSPVNITINKTGEYAYVTSGTTNKIAQFSVGISGDLTPLTPAFPSLTPEFKLATAGGNPQSISIDPTGNYAYVTYNAAGKVALFTISSGLLTETITPPVATGAGPWGVTTDPSGKFLYVANNETSTVSQFSIGMGGALSALSPATVVTGGAFREAPYFISVDPTGKYAYVSNGYTSSLAQFSIDSSSGVLTPLSPSSVVTQGTPFNVKTDPTGRFVYVVNFSTGSISQYTVGSNGALSSTRSTLPTFIHVFDIGIDPTGRYAYWTSEDDTVSQYKIDGSNGTLSQISAPLVLGALGTKLPKGIAIY